MSGVLGLDTATPATATAYLAPGGALAEARHEPAPGARPEHAQRLLELLEAVLPGWDAVARLAVGVGPGTFTGLRIGIATARALAQARRLPLVGVSSLRALAAGAGGPAGTVLAVLDARRGEAFAAAYDPAGAERAGPAALAPAELAARARALPAPVLAVGDGAVGFRDPLEAAGAAIPPDDSALHRLSARHVCRLAAGPEAPSGPVLPDYRRVPDAELRRRRD